MDADVLVACGIGEDINRYMTDRTIGGMFR